MSIPGYCIQEELSPPDSYFRLFRAIRESDNQLVWLQIPNSLNPSIHLIRRLENEFEITRELDSNFILKPVEFLHRNRVIYICFENFNGTSLRSLMSGPMELHQFLKLAIKITESLGSIHKKNIVHKNLSPESM